MQVALKHENCGFVIPANIWPEENFLEELNMLLREQKAERDGFCETEASECQCLRFIEEFCH